MTMKECFSWQGTSLPHMAAMWPSFVLFFKCSGASAAGAYFPELCRTYLARESYRKDFALRPNYNCPSVAQLTLSLYHQVEVWTHDLTAESIRIFLDR